MIVFFNNNHRQLLTGLNLNMGVNLFRHQRYIKSSLFYLFQLHSTYLNKNINFFIEKKKKKK